MATPEHQYDPARIYTRSTNKFDHSTPLTVGFPREVLALVGKIVSSGVWGEYRSNQDFVRDAVVHRLQTMMDTRLRQHLAARHDVRVQVS